MNDEVSQAGDGSDILRRLLGVAAVIVIIAGLRSARPVLVPLALATFLVVTSLPILRELRRNRVPDLIAVPLVLMLIVSMLIGVGAIALNSIMQIRDSLPQYVDRLTEMYENTFRWLGEHRIIAPEAAAEIMVSPPQLVELATGFVRSFAGFMSLVVLVTLITLFMLAEAGGVPRKVRTAMGRDDADLGRYGRVMAEIQRYLAIKTAASMATGLLLGLWTFGVGLDFALFWGLSAFLLNFIPTIGSLVAAVPAILIALLQLGPSGAMLTATGYLVVNMGIGNLLEPAVMGRQLSVSPLIVLLSLLFWGWVWGPIGALLSLPLTMGVKIVFENTQDLAWIAVLMGPASDQRVSILNSAPARRADDIAG
jgi:predicted PurR-regulated permease PerM